MRRAAIVVGVVVALSALANSAGLAATYEWINKDFTNSKNEVRNDIYWVIRGHVKDAIVATYDDNAGVHFGEPTIEEGTTDPPENFKFTIVDWPPARDPITPGGSTHVGVLVDRDKWPAGLGEPVRFLFAVWTLDGVPMEEAAGCAGVAAWALPDTIVLKFYAPADPHVPGVTIDHMSYAFVDSPFPLAELTFNSPAIPWIGLPGTYDVPSGQPVDAARLPGFTPGQYLVVQAAVRFLGEAPATAGHVIWQKRTNQTIPTLSEWGAIIFGVLLLASVVVYIWRRRRVAVA